MKETNYWEQFLSTGKLSDYLSYKGISDKEGARQEEETAEETAKKGVYPNAGTGQCYRYDIESGTFRGI